MREISANNVDGEKSVLVRPRPRKTIQDVLLSEGLLAAQFAVRVESLPDLQEELIDQLSQNSIETRRRYAQSVIRWFFTDGLPGLVARVWAGYRDEPIIKAVVFLMPRKRRGFGTVDQH